jgi:hypothetical protein
MPISQKWSGRVGIYNLTKISGNTQKTSQFVHAVKTQYRKCSQKRICKPQPKCPQSCVCERFICTLDRSPYIAAEKDLDRFWDRHINVEIGTEAARAIPFWEYTKWDFRCSALYTVEEEDLPDGVELDGELAGEDGEEEEGVQDDEGTVVALLLDQRPHTL